MARNRGFRVSGHPPDERRGDQGSMADAAEWEHGETPRGTRAHFLPVDDGLVGGMRHAGDHGLAARTDLSRPAVGTAGEDWQAPIPAIDHCPCRTFSAALEEAVEGNECGTPNYYSHLSRTSFASAGSC